MHPPSRALRRAILAGLLAAGYAGCAGTPRRTSPAVQMRRDSDGAALEVMPPFPVACQDGPNREQVALTFARRRNRFDESVFEISIVNAGRTPLAVAEGGSLTFQLDGKGTGFRTFGAADTLRDGANILPVAATYIVTYAELVGIAEATSVKLRIDANGGPLDRCFDRHSTANLKRFVSIYPPL